MMSRNIHFCLFSFLYIFHYMNFIYCQQNISLVVVLLNSGFHYPEVPLPEDFVIDDEGYRSFRQFPGQLTNLGKLQSSKLGKLLRNRYGNLLNNNYTVDKLSGIACKKLSCQETMLALYKGLYPSAADTSSENTTLKLDGVNNDITLAEECYYVKQLKETYEFFKRQEENASGIMIYLAKHCNINSSIFDLSIVADHWRAMDLLGVTPPRFLEQPSLDGYSATILFDRMQELRLQYKSLCSMDTTCTNVIAGPWINNLNQILKTIKSPGGVSTPRILINVADEENMLAITKLFEFSNFDKSKAIASTAGLLLEVAQDDHGSLMGRMFQHYLTNETAINSEWTFQLLNLTNCDYEGWCPIERIVPRENIVYDPNLCNGSSKIMLQYIWVIFVLICIKQLLCN